MLVTDSQMEKDGQWHGLFASMGQSDVGHVTGSTELRRSKR